uniref:Uncharacterized protein n=1 Tax=viral metagenome TaxID=1070528 RepID=A0A6C0LJQ6_9ZZZZ
MEALKLVYTTIWSDRSKERFEMILEPFQAITQLAILSYCPIGSKLSITDNILYIQGPSWKQSLVRSYNSDKKNDLIYLFSVIKRFHMFYGFLKTGARKNNKELFDKLVDRSKIGLEKLIQTYSKTDGDHISQTLRMYIKLVDHPETFKDVETDKDRGVQIDDVFEKIVTLYQQDNYTIILCLFRLMESNPGMYETYLTSMNASVEPVNNKLKKWISDNIVF